MRSAAQALFGALVAALLCAAPGCGTLLDGPPMNRCGGDADCATGACDTERGMCVATPSAPMQISLEFVPASDPYGGAPLPVAFGPLDVAGPTVREEPFELPMTVPVQGQVRWGGPVSASITFTLRSNVPGATATRVETQTFSTPMLDEGGNAYDYAVELLPSQRYDVTIQPTGEWRSVLPPLRYAFETERGVAQPFTWDESLALVHGVVVDESGAEQSGMIVRAVEPITGRVISSTYTTGSDPERSPGYFEVRLAPLAESWLFSVNASGARIEEGRPSPSFSVDPSALFEEPDGGVRLLVPPISTQVITYRGFVEVDGRPGQGTAASLTLTARNVYDELTGVVGSFRAMVATSDEPGHEGEFTAQLLPGSYDVVVTPSSNDLGVVQESVELQATTLGEVSGQVFQVPPRTRYQGTVQTPGAEPMVDALVRGIARGSTYGDTLPGVALYARSSDVVTDPDGLFALPLDVGLYDVVVEPSSGTNWPWAIARDVAIGSSDARPTDVIELSPPVPFTGQAVFAEGLPVASAEVRAFAIITEEGGTRAIQVGRAQTDAEGRFTVLLPPAP